MGMGSLCAAAQEPALSEAAFQQALLDLRTDLRLMCVAAHPDDEDGATLALYRKRYGVKTIAVIATRGEGGQNEIGPELYNELGVIRTREMMRAARVTGAELHFLNLPEFGFSKSPEETFEVWGREETVRRLTRVIRLTQPDVIISNHGTQNDHGHHQAIGIALQDAFDAAGDATRFTELEDEGIAPWQPQVLYLRAWRHAPDATRVDFNGLDPVRGKTYAEIAAMALDEHDSQGMGFFIDLYRSGRIHAAYLPVKQSAHANVNGAAPPPNAELLRLLKHDRLSPARSGSSTLPPSRWRSVRLPSSRESLKPSLMNEAARAEKRKGRSPEFARYGLKVGRAAALAAELRLSVAVDDETVIPGGSVRVTAAITDFGERDISDVVFAIEPAPWFAATAPPAVSVDLTTSQTGSAELTLAVPDSARFTVPEAGRLFDPHFMEPHFSVVARARATASDARLELREPVTLRVAPPVQVDFVGAPYLVRRGHEHTCTFTLALTNHAPGPITGDLLLSMAPGFLPAERRVPFQFSVEGEQRVISVGATIGDNLAPREYLLNAVVDTVDDSEIGAARLVDLCVPESIYVGVVQSYDDTFVKTLAKMGVHHKAITLDDFAADRLDRFSTVLVDIRAYLVRPDLVANNRALLDYVARGGNLIVNYQKTEEWDPQFAPYPIRLSRNRVTREDAPVTVLVPDHPVFNAPNRIHADDWDGWIQERGLYFPDQWDEKYTPLLACSDPGEEIPPGALLIAQYGKGAYIYTALGWYRQIRELHPGALRVFANMLALTE
ncbi:MAG: hypothetical protein AMXMBFR4_02710 [Candidatus Hydrogenedentota bacterium]